jgi:hypothetical protein
VANSQRIQEGQTTQRSKEKGQNDKQRSTKHTHKTKDRVTRTPLKTGGELEYEILVILFDKCFQYNYITINSNGRQDNKLQQHELHFWQNSNFQTQNSQRQKTKRLLAVTWTRAQMGDGINLLNEISNIYQIV